MGSKLIASILVFLMLASVLPIMLTSTLSVPPAPTPPTIASSPGPDDYENILYGGAFAYNKNTHGDLPWQNYPTGTNPPVMVANEVGSGRVVATGTSATNRDAQWVSGEYDVLLDQVFQWLNPGASNILWYEGHNVYTKISSGGNSTALGNALESDGYTMATSSTQPITSTLLQGYDVVVLPQLQEGDRYTGGNPDLLLDSEVTAIVSYVNAGGGLLLMDQADSHGYNFNLVHNKILKALDFGMYFQNDGVEDETASPEYYPVLEVNTGHSIGSAYDTAAGKTTVKVYSACSLAGEPPYALGISIWPTFRYEPFEEVVTYEVTVKNMGAEMDNCNLVVTDTMDWLPSISPERLENIESGGSGSATVTVTMGEEEFREGTEISVEATSEGDNSFSRTVSVIAMVAKVLAEPVMGEWATVSKSPYILSYGVAVTGAGDYIYVANSSTTVNRFWRYNTITGAWDDLKTPPKSLYNGTVLSWDNGNYIYVLFGGAYNDIGPDARNNFQRFNISTGDWENLPDTPDPNNLGQTAGDAMTWVPGSVFGESDNYIYVSVGGISTGGDHGLRFMCYSVENNTWDTTLTSPTTIGWDHMDDGASFVWTGGDYFYALRGEAHDGPSQGSAIYDFARYDLINDQWESREAIPKEPYNPLNSVHGTNDYIDDPGVGDGAGLLWTNIQPNYVYALRGGNWVPEGDYGYPGPVFFRYDIASDEWEPLENLPAGVSDQNGNRLGFAHGNIYCWRGYADSTYFTEDWKYDTDNLWVYGLPIVSVSISPTSKSGTSGATLEYTVTVTNTGETENTYNLENEDDAGWTLSLSKTSMTLAAGASDTATLSVTVGVPTGSVDNITVTATSTADPDTKSSASCTAMAVGVYDVEVSISPESKKEVPEETLTYTVTVNNTGGTEDTYSLEATDNASWTLSLDNTSLTIAAGGNETTTLRVTIPSGAFGEVDNVTVTATGTGVSDSDSCIAEVFPQEGSVEFNPSDDAHVRLTYPTSNSGSYTDISVGAYYSDTTAERSFLKFDLSEIPAGSTITSADLFLYHHYGTYDPPGIWVELWTVENDDWDEMVITWDDQPSNPTSGDNLYNEFINDDNDEQFLGGVGGVDVTSYIESEYDGDGATSFCLFSPDENTVADDVDFSSKETTYGENQKPRLSVSYNLVALPWDVRVSISPSENEGSPGDNVTFTVTVKNTGENTSTYDLTSESDDTDWLTYLSEDTVGPLSQNQNSTVTLTVTIPGSASSGDSTTVTVTATSQENPDTKDNATCTATVETVEENYDVEVSISPENQTGIDGETLTYTVTVKNTGGTSDTYALFLTDTENWSPTLDNMTLSIAAGENQTTTLRVTIPEDAAGGDNDNITVTATSQADGTVSDSASTTADVEPRYEVEVSILPESDTGMPGDNIAYTVTVTNKGNMGDNYTLENTADNADWGLALTKSSMEIVAKESDDATLTVTVPAGAEVGDEITVTVTATSTTDNTVSDNDTCTTTVMPVSVSISPWSKTGAAGDNLTYTVTVTNIGEDNDTYDLTVTDNASPSWTPSLDNTTMSVTAGENQTTTLRVTIPENAAIGDVDEITVAATSTTDSTIKDNATATATVVPAYDVSVSISPASKTGGVGETITYTVTINNIGARDDNYTLGVTDTKDWNPTLSDNLMEIAAGGSDNATLTVVIPDNAAVGEVDVITVTATSQVDNTVSDNAICTAVVVEEYEVGVSIEPEDLERLPREELIYTVTVTNTGNMDDNYDLTVTDTENWSPTLSDNLMEMAAGASDTAILSVTILDNADIGDVDNITVTATSTTDNTVSGSATCTATVVFEYTIQIWFIPGGENRVANFENENIPVLEVKIIVENSEDDLTGTITVTVLENIVGAVPSGMVHRYLNIVTSIQNANIKGLLAKFRVSKSWVDQNDIDEETIRMYENNENGWQELTTERVDNDEKYLYFQAEGQGLSLFAITGSPRKEAAPAPILLIALAVAAASAGGVGAAIVWYKPELPSLRSVVRLPRLKPKGETQLRLPEGLIKDVDRWVKEGKFRSRGDAIRTILTLYDERERTRGFYKMLAERSGEAKKKSKSLVPLEED